MILSCVACACARSIETTLSVRVNADRARFAQNAQVPRDRGLRECEQADDLVHGPTTRVGIVDVLAEGDRWLLLSAATQFMRLLLKHVACGPR